MKELHLKNNSLTRLLSSITNKVFTNDNIEKLNSISVEDHYPHATSPIPNFTLFKYDPNGLLGYKDEFLYEALKLKLQDYSYPPCIFHVGTGLDRPERFKESKQNILWDLIGKDVIKLMTFLGSHENALVAYYPNNGYIGWHHNGNAPGYNILMSYSTDGNGYFKYYDRDNNKVVYMNDKPGWNLKVGYYPDERKEPERVYWHAAATTNPRLSIAFIVRNKEMWTNMIEDLTSGEFNREDVLGQGPK